MPDAPKDRVKESVYLARDKLVGLAHDIHEHPELAYCEVYSANKLSGFLAGEGFAVKQGVYGMPTAFVAVVGRGPLHIAFCAEYDALPPTSIFDRSKPPELVEIWLTPERKDEPLVHGCGHHLIAGSSIAAAVGLRDFVDQLGLTISVFGTPGEELIGLPEPRDGRLTPGKIEFLKAGAFSGVHAAMMIHPFPTPWSVFLPTTGLPRLRAQFSRSGASGRQIGESELKALRDKLKQAVIGFQQTPGLYAARAESPPAGAQADFCWVAPSGPASDPARAAVRHCFEETASTAGVSVTVTEYSRDADMRHDPLLSAAFRENSRVLGRVREKDPSIQQEIRKVLADPRMVVAPPGLFMSQAPLKIVWSTDLANVSQVIPAIQPHVGVGGTFGPHTPEFATDGDTDEAYRAMLDAGVSLAWTAVDAATDPKLKAYLLGFSQKRSPQAGPTA